MRSCITVCRYFPFCWVALLSCRYFATTADAPTWISEGTSVTLLPISDSIVLPLDFPERTVRASIHGDYLAYAFYVSGGTYSVSDIRIGLLNLQTGHSISRSSGRDHLNQLRPLSALLLTDEHLFALTFDSIFACDYGLHCRAIALSTTEGYYWGLSANLEVQDSLFYFSVTPRHSSDYKPIAKSGRDGVVSLLDRVLPVAYFESQSLDYDRVMFSIDNHSLVVIPQHSSQFFTYEISAGTYDPVRHQFPDGLSIEKSPHINRVTMEDGVLVVDPSNVRNTAFKWCQFCDMKVSLVLRVRDDSSEPFFQCIGLDLSNYRYSIYGHLPLKSPLFVKGPRCSNLAAIENKVLYLFSLD